MIHLKTNSMCVHRWVSDMLSGKLSVHKGSNRNVKKTEAQYNQGTDGRI